MTFNLKEFLKATWRGYYIFSASFTFFAIIFICMAGDAPISNLLSYAKMMLPFALILCWGASASKFLTSKKDES